MNKPDRGLAILVGIMFAVSVLTFAVSLVAAFEPPQQHQQSEKASDQKHNWWWWWPAPEGWTALFTGALTVSTIGLWFATRRSATIAERALTELERPHVFAEITKSGIDIQGRSINQPQANFSTLELRFFNVGRSPAFPTHRAWEAVGLFGHNAPEPFDPSAVRGDEFPEGIALIGERVHAEWENMFRAFRIEARTLVPAGQMSVWCHGFIRYRDIFGDHHITGFTFAYDLVGDRFVMRGDKKRNYTRDERPEDIPPTAIPNPEPDAHDASLA